MLIAFSLSRSEHDYLASVIARYYECAGIRVTGIDMIQLYIIDYMKYFHLRGKVRYGTLDGNVVYVITARGSNVTRKLRRLREILLTLAKSGDPGC